MKVLFVLLVVCCGSLYAQQSSTSSTNMTTPSSVEKEDATDKKPNLPVRMMPLTGRSNTQSDYPSGSSPRTSRTGYPANPSPQASTAEHRGRIPAGRAGRQMPPPVRSEEDNQRQGQSGPNQESRAPTDAAVPSFGYRAVWQDDRGTGRALIENEDGVLPQHMSGRNRNPRIQYGGQPRNEDDSRMVDEANMYDGEGLIDPRTPIPTTEARNRQGDRFQGGSMARALPGGDRQTPAPQDQSEEQQGNLRRADRDQMNLQPREDFPSSDNRRFPVGQGPRTGHDGTWTSYRNYGAGSRDEGVLYSSPDEPHQHRPYSFNYISQSDDGMHGHQQVADGSGKVIGSYSINLGDGRKRIVEYIADENGFRASIDSNELGMSQNENPADVVYFNTPGTTERRSGLPVGQGNQGQRVPLGSRAAASPTTTSSRRYPTYGSQGAPTSTRLSPDSRVNPQANHPNDYPGFSMYGVPPMLPSRRRLADPQDSNDDSDEEEVDDTPAYGRSLDNAQGYPLNRQDISRQPSQPEGYDEAPMPPNTRMLSPDGGRSITRGARNQDPEDVPPPPTYRQETPAENSFMASAGPTYTDNSEGNGNRFWFRRSS